MKRVVVALLILCSAGPVWGQKATQPRFTFRVKVEVKHAPNHSLFASHVESYLKQELRELADVTVTNEDPMWVLSVIGGTYGAVADGGDQYYMSVTVLRIMGTTEFQEEIRHKVADKKFAQHLIRLFQIYPLHETSYLQGGSTTGLKKACAGIVAEFDAKSLELFRPR